jgi:hypothetical protein
MTKTGDNAQGSLDASDHSDECGVKVKSPAITSLTCTLDGRRLSLDGQNSKSGGFYLHSMLIIVEHGQGSVSIDIDMQILMHQEVIAWTLADNPEIIDEREVRLTML